LQRRGLPAVDLLEVGSRLLRAGQSGDVLTRDRVEPEVEAVERKALDQLESVRLDGVVVGRVHEVETLDAAPERLQTRRGIGDGPNDQRIQEGRLTPVVLVANERRAVIRNVVLEGERTGPGLDDIGVQRRVREIA